MAEDKNKKTNGSKPSTSRSTPRKDEVKTEKTITETDILPDQISGVGKAGFTDYNMRGRTTNYYAYKMGIDPSQTTERNMRAEAIARTKSASARQYLRDRQKEDRQDFRDRMAYLNGIEKSNQKKYDDANYAGRKFSSRKGWENLGNTEGRTSQSDIQGYGKDHEAYKKGWGELSGRMAKLTEYYKANGNMGGRQKEFEEVSKLINDSHNGKGLSQAQMEAATKKMDSYLGSINQKLEYGNRATAYYAKRDLDRQRKELGDSAGILSDEQVRQKYSDKRWGNIRGAMSMYDKTLPTQSDPGSVSGYANGVMNGRFDAMEAMQKNGISLSQMAKIAVQSGQGDWGKQYDDILKKGGDSTQAIENLGYNYLKATLGQKGGEAAIDAAIKNANTVTAKKPEAGPNQLLSWDSMSGAAPVEPGNDKPNVSPIEPAVSPAEPQLGRSPRDAANDVVGSMNPEKANGAAKGVYGPTQAKAEALDAAVAQKQANELQPKEVDTPVSPAVNRQVTPAQILVPYSAAAGIEQQIDRDTGKRVIEGEDEVKKKKSYGFMFA